MFPYLSSVVQLSLSSNICLVTTRFTFHIKLDVFKTCQSLIIFSNECWQSHQGRTSLVAIFSELNFALKKITKGCCYPKTTYSIPAKNSLLEV